MKQQNMQQPPLIVHIIYTLGTGGLENGLVNIINRCPPSRYRHAIICLSHSEDFSRRLTAENVEIIELHKKPGHDLAMYWRLWQHLRRLRPAVVHTRNLAALETHVLGLLLPGCKRVHGEHGRDMHDLDGSNRKYQWLRRLLNPLIHHFIAVSQDLSRWLTDTVQIPNTKVSQIYNGVDTTRFVHHQNNEDGLPAGFLPPEGAVVLGTVGRLVAVKNQQLLLQAMHSIVSARPPLRATLRLIMVGDGAERAALTALTEKLQLSDLIWMAGDRDNVPELLRSMDIFVLPSLGEGISNTLLEAMATGLPAIASAVGGNPELVEPQRTGLLFPSGDAAALAAAIEELVDNPALRQTMGQAAAARIRQNFSWERTVENYLALYDMLLTTGAERSRARGH